MKLERDLAVVTWLDTQPRNSLWTTAITVFEIRNGLELMAHGRRREGLEDAFTRALQQALDGRVIPFDESAAQAAGRIAAARSKIGRSVEVRDVQIAGIALARNASIATRNIRHFEGLGIPLIDPWSA
jgi:predicted nucleic acid-binding protein